MIDDSTREQTALVRAALACVETRETLAVLWNPARYRLDRRNLLHTSEAIVAGGPAPGPVSSGREERFETTLFIDTTEESPGPGRDARRIVDRLVGWSERVRPGLSAPSRVVFVWGPFRFDGVLESIEEEWLRFDADGTPVRAWVTIVLRR